MSPGSGEFAYIEWLRRQTPTDARVLIGPGDDCAALRFNADASVLVTTDMLMDGTCFRLAEVGPRPVGRKAMAVNLSDIAAMAGRPMAAVVSVALPRTNGRALADIYLGKITNWNSSRIKTLNKGLNLPDLKITPVYRSDNSGTSYNFTDYLSTPSSEWRSKVGIGVNAKSVLLAQSKNLRQWIDRPCRRGSHRCNHGPHISARHARCQRVLGHPPPRIAGPALELQLHNRADAFVRIVRLLARENFLSRMHLRSHPKRLEIRHRATPAQVAEKLSPTEHCGDFRNRFLLHRGCRASPI